MTKTCCFSGYRPHKLSYLDDPADARNASLAAALRRAVDAAVADGYTTFYSGFARGVDILAAEAVLAAQIDGAAVTLIAALPCMEQSSGWRTAAREHYFALLDRCAEVVYVSDSYHPGCYKDRNRYMVDRSQRLIAVFDGQKGGTAQTVAYAKKLGRELVLIDPQSFTCTAAFEPSLFAPEL